MEENETMALLPGDRFVFKEFEWVVLDNNVDGGILAIMASAWTEEHFQFDENCDNDYKTSSLRRKLFERLLPVLGCYNLLLHKVDLTADNGDQNYGSVMDFVFILSCDEYRKYYKYTPKGHFQWTCTPLYIPYDDNIASVRFLNTDDIFVADRPDFCNGVYPACVFNPNRVKITKRIEVREREEEEWE